MLTILDPFILYHIVVCTHLVSAHRAFLYYKPYAALVAHAAQRKELLHALMYVDLERHLSHYNPIVEYTFHFRENYRTNRQLPIYYMHFAGCVLNYIEMRWMGNHILMSSRGHNLYNGSSCRVEDEIDAMIDAAYTYPLSNKAPTDPPKSNLDSAWDKFLNIFMKYYGSYVTI